MANKKVKNRFSFNIPVICTRGVVVYPGEAFHLDIVRKNSINSVNIAMEAGSFIFVVAQKNPDTEKPTLDDLYTVGTICRIVQVFKESDEVMRVVFTGVFVGRFNPEYLEKNKNITKKADIIALMKKDFKPSVKTEAMVRSIKDVFLRYQNASFNMPEDISKHVSEFKDDGDLSVLVYYICSNIYLDYEAKQEILEITSVSELGLKLVSILERDTNIREIENDILLKAKQNIDENQRDVILREHKRIIETELGENDIDNDTAKYMKKIEEIGFSEDVRNQLVNEVKKLDKFGYQSTESAMISNYLDYVLGLPWKTSTESDIDLDKVRAQLDKDHYGLTKIKDRIIESLAVKKLNPDSKGNIICLVGPPGTGKTSIAMSIARSIGRNSSRLSLGGVRDEAEIRGHRRTYIGALPGRIINAVKNAKSNNPLIILDEVDKLSNDYKGDPTSALLEVLDPEQNNAFVDHYLDIPFDLSKTMFLTTANDADAIPSPLRDRMDLMELSSYTRLEKLNIAKKHLIPKQLRENGLKRKNFKITDKAIYLLIDGYTKEAGVRNLERTLASLMRKTAILVVEDANAVVRINDKNVEDYLGPVKYIDDDAVTDDEIGIVNGLAWTAVGGTMLPIECVKMQGGGRLELTGSLGDIMQESAKTAISCIRHRADKYNLNPNFYKDYDLHIHVPDGATPKDGPSAGITLALAIYSALTMSPVRHDYAMTGEITLSGKVMPIGGLKEKAMAAYQAKIKNVIIPFENMRDLYDIDEEVKNKLNFIPVRDIDEVIKLASIKPKKITEESINVKTEKTVKRSAEPAGAASYGEGK